jgi:phage anti-repressor protein
MWTFENLLKDMTYYSYRQSLKGSQNLKNESINSALGTIDQDLAKIVEKSAKVFTDLFIECIKKGIFILNGEKGIVSIDDVEENKESQGITGNRSNDHDITINQARRKWHLEYKDPIELLLKQSNAKLKLYTSIKSYFKDSVMLFDQSKFSDILRLPELAKMLNEYEFTQRGKYATVTH